MGRISNSIRLLITSIHLLEGKGGITLWIIRRLEQHGKSYLQPFAFLENMTHGTNRNRHTKGPRRQTPNVEAQLVVMGG